MPFAINDSRRILFLDEDASYLDAIRAGFRPRSDQWRASYVETPERALVEIESEPVDAVIASSPDVLRVVSRRWPHTVRIALAKDTELQRVKNAAPGAHQYLSKACNPIQIENCVERSLNLRSLLSHPELQSLVGRIHSLPTIPRTYALLQNVVADENCDVSDVAKVIAADTAIAAKVLQLANSAFYGMARRIANIQQAVTFLGLGAICNLVLSAEVFTRWSGTDSKSSIDVDRLQLHARTVAAVGHAISAKTAIADDVVLSGLLHDIGYWVLLQECPTELERAIELAASKAIPLDDAEVQVIGASHASIGAYLLGMWGLPYPIVEAVAHHHAPQSVHQTEFDVLAATAIAHSLAGLGDSSGFRVALVPDAKVDGEYLRAVNAPFDWAEAERRVAESLRSEESIF